MQITCNVKLKKWQKDAIGNITNSTPSAIHVIKAKRQIGKSILVEIVLLHYAINKKGTVSICISPTLKQGPVDSFYRTWGLSRSVGRPCRVSARDS